MPTVSKKRGPTTFALMTVASPTVAAPPPSESTRSWDDARPSTCTLSTRPLPPSIATRATLADSTPGRCSARSSTCW